MKKLTLSLILAISALTAEMDAQVGINNTTPASTLDITAKSTTGTTTSVEGLLIPRVNRQKAQSMTGVSASTLIYVSGVVSGSQTGTAINIDSVGFYYFDGSVWIKLKSGATQDVNIYNANGSLTGDRIVSQGTHTLAFNGTATNSFSVDGSTFSVDAPTNRVGIGTIAPIRKLHVEGSQFLNAVVSGANTKEALDINIGQDGFTPGNRTDNFGINMRTASSTDAGAVARINFGDTATSGLSGTGSRYLSFSVGKPLTELMYLTNNTGAGGRVGIDNTNPASSLDISAVNPTGTSTGVEGVLIPRVNRERAQSMTGVPVSTLIYVNGVVAGSQTGTAVNIDSVGYYYFNGTVWVKMKSTDTPDINIYSTNGSLTGDRIVTQGTNTLAFPSNIANAFSVGGSVLSVDTFNNRVGIGTTTPSAQLQLSSTVANRKIVLFQAVDNDNQFSGFGINANVLRYQVSATNGNHVFYSGVDASNSNELMRIQGTGNVGIGTSAPTSNLDVNGDVRVRVLSTSPANTVIAPVYTDSNGVLVKMAPATYGTVISNTSPSIGAGSTNAIISGLPDGAIYKAVVRVSDGCADTAVTEFYINCTSGNNYYSVTGLGGSITSTAVSPTFTIINRASTQVTWSSKIGCSDGTTAIGFNYTITMPSAGTINITNNGSTGKVYLVTLSRIN